MYLGSSIICQRFLRAAWHSQPVQIRAAQGSDVVALNEIVERAYSIYIERIGRRPAPMDDDYVEKLREGHVFVVDDGGEVVGFIVLLTAQDHLLVENVAVDPEHQGKGVGRSLMAFAETYATERRVPELRLYNQCCDDREPRPLFPFGYREDDRRTENDLKRVFLSKRLDSPGHF